jgi:hypothetical protein
MSQPFTATAFACQLLARHWDESPVVPDEGPTYAASNMGPKRGKGFRACVAR